MTATHVLGVDLAKVLRRDGDKFTYLTTVAWGDPLEVLDVGEDLVRVAAGTVKVETDGSPRAQTVEGFIRVPKGRGLAVDEVVTPLQANPVLKVDFVDVQQGDAAVIESPKGEVTFVDGGDNQLFARYLANRFRGSSPEDPKEVAAIVVTHGDADHFSGLTEIHRSEENRAAFKRLFIRPRRVFHNGLAKRPSSRDGKRVRDEDLLGETVELGGRTHVTGLYEDLLAVADGELNEPFREWKNALSEYASRSSFEMRRLERGDDDAFDFLRREGIHVEVLGPTAVAIDGKPALPFFGTPRDDPELRNQPVRPPHFTGKSASHTINGHSIILRVKYGNARFMFAGDLNEEAERDLVALHDASDVDLTSEVLKVPHHGSADFSQEFLERVAPVISVVSSGDESSLKEFIHPRAPLVGALGRFAREGVREPIVFVTEMVAFFEMLGWIRPEFHKLSRGKAVVGEGGTVVLDAKARKEFFAFRRAAFGIVKVRTDGKRLLVWTNSGQAALKEAYALDLESDVPRRVGLKRL